MYGDFMALPPADQRKAKHRIRQLDFGDATPSEAQGANKSVA
jgi:hypothetical protein